MDEEVEVAARPIISDLLRTLANEAAQLRNQHPRLFDEAPFIPTFVSALAEGADQFGAVVALENGYRLEAILPLPREDYRQEKELRESVMTAIVAQNKEAFTEIFDEFIPKIEALQNKIKRGKFQTGGI